MAQVERICADIEALKAITQPAQGGITRPGFSAEYRLGADYMKMRMHEAGLAVREDSIGNIYGRLSGTCPDAPVFLSGSHLDTVINAGAYDGIVGVVCALEAARMLQENGHKLRHSYEVVGTIEEEGTTFGQVVMGSKFMTGLLDEAAAAAFTDARGRSFAQVAAGYRVEGCCPARRARDEVAAVLELHDEQGPHLEAAGADAGIVGAIVAMSQLTVEITGFSGHAGTVPMGMRRDAMAAAAEIISGLTRFTETLEHPATATVGCLTLHPGAANCIPGGCTFRVDVRSGSRETADRVIENLNALCRRSEETRGVTVTIVEDSRQDAIRMDEKLQAVLWDACHELGLKAMNIDSGAGHDSMVFAPYWPTAMLFLPCRDGVSHNPAEYVSPQALVNGADVLYKAIIEIDKMEDQNHGRTSKSEHERQ